MNDYRNYINELADKNSPESFVNSGPEHAAVVISTIFAHANNYVFLFSGDLNGAVCNDAEYQKQLGEFLLREGNLKVLVQKYNSENEPKIYNLLRFYKNLNLNVEVKYHPFEVISPTTEKEIHFTVGDDKMYRIENDVEKYLAYGSFNDNDQAIKLKDLFEDIFEDEQSELIHLL